MKFNRIGEWREFSDYMLNQYLGRTQDKYEESEELEFDLMAITNERICLYNIIKYAMRLWKGKGKEHDFEKIIHYSQIAWSLNKKEEINRTKFDEEHGM